MRKLRNYCLALALVVLSMLTLAGCNKLEGIDKVAKDLDTYSITANVDVENMTMTCRQVLNYTNRYDTIIEDLDFHLYPRAFSEGIVNKPVNELDKNNAYPNGVDYGDIVITEIKYNGEVVDAIYEGQDSDILVIDTTLNPYDTATVEMAFEIDIPNIIHRFGYGNNTINLGNFYPILCVYEDGAYNTSPYAANGDPFYSNVANYDVTITYDSDYTLAHTGYVVDSSTDGEVTTTNIAAKAVRDFAFVLSDKFEIVNASVDGVDVRYMYYEQDNPEVYLQTAVDAISTFNKLFGPYPYSTLDVVKTNFIEGGMEYPNLVYISDAVEGVEDYNNTIIHEIAHQWWYGVVGNNEYVASFLDEGLTDYSCALFYEANPSYGVDYSTLISTTRDRYITFVDFYKDTFGDIDTSMDRALNEYGSEYEYVYCTYVKGALFFDSLRELIGNNKFMKGLQRYYVDNAYSIATVSDLLNAMERESRCDLGSFFDCWIEGKVEIFDLSKN